MSNPPENIEFVRQFRDSAPYINAFRGRLFVIYFGGEALQDQHFAHLVHDIALLHSLVIQLVLIHGSRPQIIQKLGARHSQYEAGIRITDDPSLLAAKEATGSIRVELEARLSMALANSPMDGLRITLTSGNFITAKPYGVRHGVDYLHTGEVRRIDAEAINKQLAQQAIVLLSPLGYSPSGDVFNLMAEDVAFEAAKALRADKLLCLFEKDLLKDEQHNIVRQLTYGEVNLFINQQVKGDNHHTHKILIAAKQCCQHGVRRVHFLNRHIDGALLQELFTRDGVGSLISADQYEGTRPAKLDDIPGILELITPLEEQGMLVKRSHDKLEMDIDNFMVTERDGMIIACAAVYEFIDNHTAELACLAVHPQYQKSGRGHNLLDYLENKLSHSDIGQIFVLSTRASHWFTERGFKQVELDSLPLDRKTLYNYQRNSKIFSKQLSRTRTC